MLIVWTSNVDGRKAGTLEEVANTIGEALIKRNVARRADAAEKVRFADRPAVNRAVPKAAFARKGADRGDAS